MKILLVEDEFLIAAEIRFHLERAGFAGVEYAATETDALAAIAAGGWDAAIVDANLNGRGIDGVALALQGGNIPFVIVTGYGRNGLPETLARVPVIEKPFNPQNLVDAVSRLRK
jgi:DNA-binding response OmpR family regulator